MEALSFEPPDGYNVRISSEVLLLRGMGFWGQPFDQKDSPRGFTEIDRTTHYLCVEITFALLEMNK